MKSLADAIIAEDLEEIRRQLHYSSNLNQLDEYGFTPLIQAAIVDNGEISQWILATGANVNLQDMVGGTALHWAAENNNVQLAELLLKQGADPNSYTLAGQPVLVMPLLRGQQALKNLLISYGADLDFAQDYINTKLIGHLFELIGTVNIVDPKNNFVEVDFEGFYLDATLGLITDSLLQYKNHFAARQARKLGSIVDMMLAAFNRAADLVKYQQYRVNIKKHSAALLPLLQEPLIIPIGYEGHAITFIKLKDILIKCDRRESSRLYDNVMIYRMRFPERCSSDFIKNLMFEKQTDTMINDQLPEILGLQPLTEIKIAAQISGNCSWANVEACIPALLFLLSSEVADFSERIPYYKSQALNFFHQWREWNKERTLNFCIQRFNSADSIRKLCNAEILAAVLFQRLQENKLREQDRIEAILPILLQPKYDYILRNYVRAYCYEDYSEEGSQFLRLLESYGFDKKG
jgi:hypothetical protein